MVHWVLTRPLPFEVKIHFYTLLYGYTHPDKKDRAALCCGSLFTSMGVLVTAAEVYLAVFRTPIKVKREWCMRGQLSIPHCQSSYLSRFEYPFNTIVDPTDLK